MKTRTIRQSATFSASPEIIYSLLMDPEKHAAFTGSEVRMSENLGEEISVFSGYCTGYNIALEKGKKIIQKWHFDEDGWPENHYSLCTFILEADGEKTRLNFIQEGVPAHKFQELSEGWKEYYWKAMKTYLKNN